MRQLIYTSALSGIAQPRSGFCTVARHASLRERTVAELERMSEYEPPAGTRPTVFLFRVHSGGNETLYILTRAGDAGTDVFGRPNHVVHHLIFGEDEIALLPPPAEVALRFRGWCEKFSGEPHFFPENEPLPREILRGEKESLLPARRWAALTGDAGNAALLCPHGDPRATVFLGDETMTELALGLFAESAETLGGGNAWEVAFSTGICSRDGAGRFLWRMVGENEVAVRRPGDFILDFLAPLSMLRAPATEFAERARNGKKTEERRAAPRAGTPPHFAGTPDDADAQSDAFPPSTRGNAEHARNVAAASAEKHFSDIAGTAKFLGIAGLVFVVVMLSVLFLVPKGSPSAPHRGNAAGLTVAASDEAQPAAGTSAGVRAFRAFLEERIAAGDFVGAAEAWISFSEAFPQDAAALRTHFVPRFKLKIAGAYAERFERRLRVAEMGGKLSAEEKRLLAAELGMFRRACREFDLTEGRIQKKNLAVIERAEVAAETVPAGE